MIDRLTILTGDCRDTLRTLENESVHCVVTSPPYYGLRDYQTGEWSGGDPDCTHVVGELRRGLGLATSVASTRGGGHKAATIGNIQARGVCPHCGAVRVDNQIGLESTPEVYIETMVEVFREVRRVLRSDGTLYLNLGDSYANDSKWGGHCSGKNTQESGRSRHVTGLPPKSLMGIPWRVAIALQADGWILRQDIIWSKPNPMPEPVTDRCTKSHEYIFLFSKSGRYFFDADAIAESVSPNTHARLSQNLEKQIGSARAHGGAKANGPMKAVARGKSRNDEFNVKNNTSFAETVCLRPDKRNKRSVWEVPEDLFSQFLRWLEDQPRVKSDVWTVATQGYRDAHFATFPEDLIKPAILAGCPTSGTHCDCEDIIASPTGEGENVDPTMIVGRAGYDRRRALNGGVHEITRRQQRWEAKQLKNPEVKNVLRIATENMATAEFDAYWKNTFKHYLRTDIVGARALPESLRERFQQHGFITDAPPCSCPIQPPGIVLDPFGGSGTTGQVSIELGRRAILCELNPAYRSLIEQRCDVTPGFAFTTEAGA